MPTSPRAVRAGFVGARERLWYGRDLTWFMRMRRHVFSLLCALALAGCNDHRYGFFGDTEGEGGTTEATGTTTVTTLSPTTLPPTTLPTTLTDPTTTTTDPTLPTTITTPATVTSVVTTDVTDTTGGIPCGDLFLPSEVPTQGFGTLLGQPDAFALSCGGIGGSDLAFVWTAPFTGKFLVETAGSNVDTLLGVIDGVCFGPELRCDDDGAPDQTSRVEVDLFGGQTVTFVVDSFSQGFGDVVLTVSEVPIDSKCPDGDFGSAVPFQTTGQTAGAPNVRAAFCGGDTAPEIEALWTAPFEGTFTFQVTEADFDPVLYLLGGDCSLPEFECSDDFDGLNPRIDVLLPAGQQVIIVVDGAGGQSGKFSLLIDQLF